MHKALKWLLGTFGSLLAIALIIFIVLYFAGSQTVEEPVVEGIEPIDVPFMSDGGQPVTVTWRVTPTPTATALYVSPSPRDVRYGVPPIEFYEEALTPTLADGTYSAAIPAGQGVRYARIYAEIGGAHTWSNEFEVLLR